MKTQAKILIVDDDELVLESLKQVFMDDYDVSLSPSGQEALSFLGKISDFSAIILDIKMARMDGLQTATQIRKIQPEVPIIFYTGYPGDYSEGQIEKDHRPFDFVIKNERLMRLTRAVKNAVAYHRLKSDSVNLVDLARREYGIVGKSSRMKEVYEIIERIAPTDNKIMILGPTGSGKELVARAIYRRSRRSSARLAILNCNHKQAELVEAELFGHKRGAFTSAFEDRIGMFEYADGGTLFLDEIGDLDITTQAKLLRVIETGEMQKIGSPEILVVDVRLICATHHELPQMVRDGSFREDLYYRLKGITIRLPALRDRREDIPILIDHFTESYCMKKGDGPRLFEPAAIDLLIEYEWPGNVRQLQDTVHSLIDLAHSSLIPRDEVADYLDVDRHASTDTNNLNEQLREYKKTLIIQALARHNNNVSAAARELSIDPANLHRIIKNMAIDLV